MFEDLVILAGEVGFIVLVLCLFEIFFEAIPRWIEERRAPAAVKARQEKRMIKKSKAFFAKRKKMLRAQHW